MNWTTFFLQLLGWLNPTTTTTTTLTQPVTSTTTTVAPSPFLTTTTTTQTGDDKVKVALCVGINKYPNPANNLSGCVNDAKDNAQNFAEVYKFNKIVMLLDLEATIKNVKDKISELLAMKPDVFVFTNSSHGTRVADTSGTEIDGYCEAICLYDGFFMDKDIKKLLATADPKTRITIVSDSCHSAGVTREFLLAMNDFTYESKPKYLPPEGNMEALAVGMMPISKAIFEPNEKMSEVLLAGCKSDQYSYDASFNGRPNGAFTYYMNQVLRSTPEITYGDFIRKINQSLPSSRYPQCPVLETNSNMEKTLIFS